MASGGTQDDTYAQRECLGTGSLSLQHIQDRPLRIGDGYLGVQLRTCYQRTSCSLGSLGIAVENHYSLWKPLSQHH